MPRLVALDLPVGAQLRDETERVWDVGDAVLPLDQRMPPSARRAVAVALGADRIVGPDGATTIVPEPRPGLLPLLGDDALVIATSGTTGVPRGVVHTFSSLAAHASMVGRRLGLGADDHWWLCIPAAHIGGFGVMARAIRLGARLSYGEAITRESLDLALRTGATHTSVVPTVVARHDVSGWRVVLVGGSRPGPLPDNAIATYGLTESCGGVVYDGAPLQGVEIRLDHGEVLVRSASMARSYRDAPLPLVDGWFPTGDLGTLVDGRLHVDGRRDDLVITGGNKVWPHVVEQRLREHPLVGDVAVRGVPDPEWGSVVCAWVVPRDPAVTPNLAMLRGHVKETLAAYCAPRKLRLVERLPRTALGKLATRDLPPPE